MKHEIKHQADIDGISYVNLTEAHIKDVIDFYFDVFLQGNMCEYYRSIFMSVNTFAGISLDLLFSIVCFEQ